MKVQFELNIGDNKFTLSEDVESHADFFKKLNFYSTLPKVGPNGETDLVLRHRVATTKAGKKVDYFSIVSEKAKQEFKFGQSLQMVGALFPKGWEPLFAKDSEEADEVDAPTPAPVQTAPVQAAPTPAAAPKPTPLAGIAGFNLPSATAAKPKATPAPAAAPVTPNPQVQSQAASVLAKFGINK